MISTTQINEGIIEITKVDTTKFALKSEVATKEEVQTLTSAVAGKLDASPQHHHEINDIDQLQTSLNNKLDITQRYSYSTILSDAEKIDYLDELKTTELEISTAQNQNGYSFSVDNNGDLLLVLGNVAIARYDTPTSSWLFSNVNINEVLSNHHDAIEALAGHYDNNGTMTTSALNVVSTAASSLWMNLLNVLNGNLANGHNLSIYFGKSFSNYNCGQLTFTPNGENSYVHIDLFGYANLLNVYKDKIAVSQLLNAPSMVISGTDNYAPLQVFSSKGTVVLHLGRDYVYRNGCANFRYVRDPRYLGIGFGYNDDKFKIDTNGNCQASGTLTATNITVDNETRLAQCENIITTPSSHDYITKLSNDKPFEINIDINDKTISFTNLSTDASMSNSIHQVKHI